MNKDKLQQELLAKIKPGMKPSDLKKPKKNIKSKPKTDEGYSSDENVANSPYFSSPSEVNKVQKADSSKNFADNEKKLLDQISSLKKQLQTYKDFKEADLKIKERYKETIAELQQKNSEQDKTIQELKNTAKTTVENKPEINEPKEIKTFFCSECNQSKPQTELSRVFGSFSFCLNCSKKARKEAQKEKEVKPQPIDFTCVVCDQEKQEIPSYKKIDIPYKTHLIKGQAYPVCSLCATYVKEYNEHENHEFSIGED